MLLWCKGQQQNETMMLSSNYDNRLDGVDGGATAGVANGKIIICEHDSELKKIDRPKEEPPPWLVPLFLEPKVIRSLPKWVRNGADFQTKAIQKLIDKWIPICIASRRDV